MVVFAIKNPSKKPPADFLLNLTRFLPHIEEVSLAVPSSRATARMEGRVRAAVPDTAS